MVTLSPHNLNKWIDHLVCEAFKNKPDVIKKMDTSQAQTNSPNSSSLSQEAINNTVHGTNQGIVVSDVEKSHAETARLDGPAVTSCSVAQDTLCSAVVSTPSSPPPPSDSDQQQREQEGQQQQQQQHEGQQQLQQPYPTSASESSSKKAAEKMKKTKERILQPNPYFYYRDYSKCVDPDPLTPLTAPGRVPNFPAKMHSILSRPDLQDIVAWMPHGRAWR
jgi:hypothetical protein